MDTHEPPGSRNPSTQPRPQPAPPRRLTRGAWLTGAAALAALAAAGMWLLNGSAPNCASATVPWAWGLGGLLTGVALERWWRPLAAANAKHTTKGFPTALVSQDISTLQQAFAVLTQQVNATIQTSETAVLNMGERLNRVHRENDDLHQRLVRAVARSEELSARSLCEAERHAAAVAQLAEHQASFEQARQNLLRRVRRSAAQVQQLGSTAQVISDIARQTDLLAAQADLEAQRGGPQGVGYTELAAKVRGLAVQTNRAAHQVTEGIAQATRTMDQEADQLQASLSEGASGQLDQIAQHLQSMSRTLGDVVPYLAQLSNEMDSSVGRITSDIVDTLGDMQFQDINRQLLEQINTALGSLSTHFAQLYQLIDGQAPPPPVQLEELLQRWTQDYVVHAQRVAHVLAAGQPRRESADIIPLHDARPLELAVANGPRIEIF